MRGAARRLVWATAAALLLASVPVVSAPALTDTLLDPDAAAHLDPNLVDALAEADTAELLQAVAVLGHHPTAIDLAALEALGLTAVPYSVLDMVAVEGTPAALLGAAELTGITSLWLNRPLEVVLAESVPLIEADHVGADPLGVTGAGVAIAVLDSGIDGTHPDLHHPSKTVQNVKLVGHKAVFRDAILTLEDVPNTDTTTGHGTHVASIAAGTGAASDGLYTGVAPGADLVGLGAADGVEMLTALAGYDWLLANHEQYGIRVLNNSWADGTVEYDESDPLNVASQAAYDAGITVVFAAGNDGQANGNVFNRYAWPAWVVSVAGGDKLGRLDTYSSLGDDTHHPTVMAPGSFIAAARASTGVISGINSSPADFTDPLAPRFIPPELMPYYRYGLGTSMAAPHVAGVAALMLEANPALTPDDIKATLAATATPVPDCPVAGCGAGQVNAMAAVLAALDAVAQAPVVALTATPSSGAAPLDVTLEAGAVAGSAPVVEYRWDLDGDGTIDLVTTGAAATSTYASGVWHPSVVAVGADGLTSAPATVEVRASDPPEAHAAVRPQARRGHAVTFDASGSHDPDGVIVSYRFVFGDGTEVTTDQPIATHAYDAERTARFAWVVVVTDDSGLEDAVSGSIRITP